MNAYFDSFTEAFTAETHVFINLHNSQEAGDDAEISTDVRILPKELDKNDRCDPSVCTLIVELTTIFKFLPVRPPPNTSEDLLKALKLANILRTPDQLVREKWWIRFQRNEGDWEFHSADCQQDDGMMEEDVEAEWITEVMSRICNRNTAENANKSE